MSTVRTVLRVVLCVFVLSVMILLTGGAVSADWSTITLTLVTDQVTAPVHVTHAGDGSNRLFIVEQAGTIRVWRDGQLDPEPFLDITDRVLSGGERGLLSVAFPPDYAQKGYLYVNYTDNRGDTMVARYTLMAGDPDRVDASTEEQILWVQQPYVNHNGGQLKFGPDGYLYIGMGDGGSGGDPQNRAQNPESLLGKMLRIDVESDSGELPYLVPPTNPFTDTVGYLPEIWALGLRNPWRFFFDRETGDLYIADVGQNMYEEINYQPASSPGGENYGWNIMEASHCYAAATCDQTGLTLPVWEYAHDVGRSVTGGYVYRGPHRDLRGLYIYGDYMSGRIWGLRREGETWENNLLTDTQARITSFGEDEAGHLYLADHDGAVYRLAPPVQPLFLPLILRF